MNQMMMEGKPMGGRCGCFCHKFVPLLVVVFGLLFLLGNMGKIDAGTVGLVWPILVIIAGLKKMFGSMCKCCSGGMMK